MPDEVAGRDWSAFAGRSLADVVTQLFSERLADEIERWDRACIAEGVHNRPSKNEVCEGLSVWDDLCPAHPQTNVRLVTCGWLHEPPLARRSLALLIEELPRIFGTAILPLAEQLHAGAFTLSGVEDGGADQWLRVAVPNGVFEVGRWRLSNRGSRLVALGRDGSEMPPAWSAAKVEAARYAIAAKCQVAAAPIVRRAGRPSRGPEILQVFLKLDAAGTVDYAAPLTAIYPKIRECLSGAGPQARGLGDETMRLTISSEFAARKSAQKL